MTTFKLFLRYRHHLLDLLYVIVRRIMCPFSTMEKFLHTQKTIVDIGCGHGLFSVYCALKGHAVIGFEPNHERIIKGRNAVGNAHDIWFIQGYFSAKAHSIQGACLSDVLHHSTLAQQMGILRSVYESLSKGGILLVKEICTNDGLCYQLSSLSDRLLYPKDQCLFHSQAQWTAMLESCGFTVQVKKMAFILSTNIFIATK